MLVSFVPSNSYLREDTALSCKTVLLPLPIARITTINKLLAVCESMTRKRSISAKTTTTSRFPLFVGRLELSLRWNLGLEIFLFKCTKTIEVH